MSSTPTLTLADHHTIADHARTTAALCLRAQVQVSEESDNHQALASTLMDVSEGAALLATFLDRSSVHADVVGETLRALLAASKDALAHATDADDTCRAAYAAVVRLDTFCAVLIGEESRDVLQADADAQDAALKETFPASDAAASPTNL